MGTLGAGVNVQVSVGSQNAWMQVTLDGKVQFAGTLAAGSTRAWTGQNTMRIRFARGDITSVNVNGVDKGLAADASQTVVTKGVGCHGQRAHHPVTCGGRAHRVCPMSGVHRLRS